MPFLKNAFGEWHGWLNTVAWFGTMWLIIIIGWFVLTGCTLHFHLGEKHYHGQASGQDGHDAFIERLQDGLPEGVQSKNSSLGSARPGGRGGD